MLCSHNKMRIFQTTPRPVERSRRQKSLDLMKLKPRTGRKLQGRKVIPSPSLTVSQSVYINERNRTSVVNREGKY